MTLVCYCIEEQRVNCKSYITVHMANIEEETHFFSLSVFSTDVYIAVMIVPAWRGVAVD